MKTFSKQNPVELKVYGGNLPVCPFCGNGNALFDQRKHFEGEFEGDPNAGRLYGQFECRDCGKVIPAEYAEIVYYKLDKPGQGLNSTYTEIDRISGNHYCGIRETTTESQRFFQDCINRVKGTYKMIIEVDDYSDHYAILTESMNRVKIPDHLWTKVYNRCVREIIFNHDFI